MWTFHTVIKVSVSPTCCLPLDSGQSGSCGGDALQNPILLLLTPVGGLHKPNVIKHRQLGGDLVFRFRRAIFCEGTNELGALPDVSLDQHRCPSEPEPESWSKSRHQRQDRIDPPKRRLEALIIRLLGSVGRGSKFKFTPSFLPVYVWARGRARAVNRKWPQKEPADRDRLEKDRQEDRQAAGRQTY